MNRVLFLMLALFLSCLTGCDTNTLAPANAEPTAIVPGGAVLAWVEIDGVQTLAYVDKGGPQGAVRVLYICDGPMIGPIQPGHCRSDGSDCQGDPLPDTRTGYAAPRWIGDPEVSNEALGDPTADDAGDPDVGNEVFDNADADGIVVR